MTSRTISAIAASGTACGTAVAPSSGTAVITISGGSASRSSISAAGTTDTYTITYSDDTTSTFSVYNGADGVGTGDMLASVYADSPGVVKDSAKLGGQLPAYYAKASDIPDISGKANTADLADIAISGSYDDLEDVPDSFTPSSHDHVKANITDFPSSMAPTAHKSTHATGGGDALSPADIGAQAAITASGILKGSGSAVSAATAGTDYLAPSALDDYLPKTIDLTSISASTTLSASHNGQHLVCTNSAAITITVPIDLGAGFNCTLERWGAGAVTIARSGTATLNGGSTSLSLSNQYKAAVSIVAVQANVFSVKGGLA